MDLSEIGIHVLIGVIYAAPWVVAIILASKMLGRGGGRAERSLISSFIIHVVSQPLACPAGILEVTLEHRSVFNN